MWTQPNSLSLSPNLSSFSVGENTVNLFRQVKSKVMSHGAERGAGWVWSICLPSRSPTQLTIILMPICLIVGSLIPWIIHTSSRNCDLAQVCFSPSRSVFVLRTQSENLRSFSLSLAVIPVNPMTVWRWDAFVSRWLHANITKCRRKKMERWHRSHCYLSFSY